MRGGDWTTFASAGVVFQIAPNISQKLGLPMHTHTHSSVPLNCGNIKPSRCKD